MPVLVLMGVSGAGKSTVGRLLAQRLGWACVDADDRHSAANRAKMARGEPLTEPDRSAWLADLAALIRDWLSEGRATVLACSALTRASRHTLRVDPDRVRFVHLHGSPELLAARLRARRGHFMPPDLLASQLATLEVPTEVEALTVSIDQPPEAIVEQIAAWTQQQRLH